MENAVAQTNAVAQIAAAYFANNKADKGDIAGILAEIKKGLDADHTEADLEALANQDKKTPQEIRASLRDPNYIICFLDGKPYKTLKRTLTLRNMTPEEYRERFGLPPEYPMVARNYSEARSALAKKLGLGQR